MAATNDRCGLHVVRLHHSCISHEGTTTGSGQCAHHDVADCEHDDPNPPHLLLEIEAADAWRREHGHCQYVSEGWAELSEGGLRGEEPAEGVACRPCAHTHIGALPSSSERFSSLSCDSF
jgi:hypothetical protein